MQHKHTLPLFALLLLANCSFVPVGHDDEQYYSLGSQLVLFSHTVQGELLMASNQGNLSGEELLKEITQDDPESLTPFEGYTVRVNRSGRFVSVLVCDKTGKRGLLEDAACTGRLDRNLWQSPNPQSCEFSIDLNMLCNSSFPDAQNGAQ